MMLQIRRLGSERRSGVFLNEVNHIDAKSLISRAIICRSFQGYNTENKELRDVKSALNIKI